MTSNRDLQTRRYLLGLLTDDEAERLEQEYFESPAAPQTLEHVEAAEERLIDEYLEETLPAEDRKRFETHYLASPLHRDRVETIRRLKKAAQAGKSHPIAMRTFVLAAAVVLAVGGLVWIVERARGTGSAESAPRIADNAPPARHVFAISVSPVLVRGANDSPSFVIPAGTDVVDLRLEGEGRALPVGSGRVVIRTVAGSEIWQGPVQATAPLPGMPPGVIAHAEVPAKQLVPEDYLVTLFETSPSGTTSERERYFLRVRR